MITLCANEGIIKALSGFFEAHNYSCYFQFSIDESKRGIELLDSQAEILFHYDIPLRLGEVIDGINAALLRTGKEDQILYFNEGYLDLSDFSFFKKGGNNAGVRLTEKEVQLLQMLYRQRGSVISKNELLNKIWSYVQGVETHTLETHIYRLRQKIELDPANPKILLTHESGYYVL